MSEARKFIYLVPLLAVVVIGFAVYVAFAPASDRDDTLHTIVLNCGAALRPPVEEIIEHFERRTGISVEVNYGASNLLLGQIKLSQTGDIFIPGDDFYIREAEREGLIEDVRTVASFVPVIMVRSGNPFKIAALEDVVAPGVKLGIADVRAAAIGRITPLIFEKNGISAETVQRSVAFTSVTGPELGQAVALGHIDAALIWRPVAAQYRHQAEIVNIPRDKNVVSPVAAALLNSSKQKDASREFLEFLTGTVAREIFLKYDYEM